MRRAQLAPAGLPGLDPGWSRLVDLEATTATATSVDTATTATDADAPRTFQVLDTGYNPDSHGTLLCVHGNPTWSYLWRRLLAAPPPGWRVIAPDHFGMGFSDRPAKPRTLAQRVDDLGRLTAALNLTGPVVTVAHDWGGILSLGWALRHRDQLAGVVLTNTAVHQPAGSAGPALIRLAHQPLLNELVRRTPLFVSTTTSLTWPRLPADVREAFAAPYPDAMSRAAVAEFVADIPFQPGHPSRPVVDAIAEGIRDLDVPALIMWGPRDPVFGEEHLRDLRERLPQAKLHRFERASHLLPEDAPQYPEVIAGWIAGPDGGPQAPAQRESQAQPEGQTPYADTTELPSVLEALDARAADASPAVVEVGGRSISWAELHRRVTDIGAGLAHAGVTRGDRVALLVEPSIELTVALYAVWRAGAVIVVADKGLGLRGMGRALRSARLDHLIADTPGLLAAGPMRLPGTRFSVRRQSVTLRRLTGAARSLPELAEDGAAHPLPGPGQAPGQDPGQDPGQAPGQDPGQDPGQTPGQSLDDSAAVLFTSGATGPAKGVHYRHRQVRAQLALIRAAYGLTGDDRIVAAFAPFALYGPALGIPSAVPDTDVTQPATLTAAALADAAIGIGATVVFASPAALRNVLATAAQTTGPQRAALGAVRLLMSAGAPVPAALLRDLAALLPNAEMHTPYGMTEALPVTDITLAQIEAAGVGDGVCVGQPLPGVQVRISPLTEIDSPPRDFTDLPMVTGEIWVRAAHVKDSYDSLWWTDQLSAAHPGWHRTGDVGQLDDDGRLWIQGRAVHVIRTAQGPVTPVGIEQRVHAAVPGADCAVVGVGPVGIQHVVVVLAGGRVRHRDVLAAADVTDAVRSVVPDAAAVLVKDTLPVDIRHNSKIDRVAVAAWATDMLAGG